MIENEKRLNMRGTKEVKIRKGVKSNENEKQLKKLRNYKNRHKRNVSLAEFLKKKFSSINFNQ
jgi:hypothetical protein